MGGERSWTGKTRVRDCCLDEETKVEEDCDEEEVKRQTTNSVQREKMEVSLKCILSVTLDHKR